MDESSNDRITTPEMLEAIITTLENARAEGEPYLTPTEEHLRPIEATLLHIARERDEVEANLKRENAELENFERQIDAAMHTHADEVWTQLGSPDYDPIFNLLFPPSTSREPAPREHAERLLVVADVLDTGIHPRIDRSTASRIAHELRALGERYHEHMYAQSKYQLRKTALDALEASVARIGLLQLGSLRRALRRVGIDDTDIRVLVPAPVSSRRFPAR